MTRSIRLPRHPAVVEPRLEWGVPTSPARTPPGAHPLPDQIANESIGAIRGLTEALGHLFDSLGMQVSRPGDLERILRVDNPLASRLWRLARARDPISAVALLPTINQMRGAVRAAVKAGASQAAADAAQGALDEFGRVVSTHAGDVTDFEAMIARLSDAPSDRLTLKHRREHFRSSSKVWGRQARAIAIATILHEDRHSGMQAAISVRGHFEFRVLRVGTTLETRAYLRHNPAGRTNVRGIRTPGADGASKATVGPPTLIASFGSGPTPELVPVETPDPAVAIMNVVVPALGKASSATFFLKQNVEGIDPKLEPIPYYGLGLLVPIPVELIQLDLWVPAGWSDPTTLRHGAFACADSPERARERREQDRIEVHEVMQVFRGVSRPPPSPDLAKWSDVVGHVLGEHGLEGRLFDIYRCRVAYPVLHSNVHMMTNATALGAMAGSQK